ncbi:hypothetical protein [Frondihabitans cladoniiphilus]|uniref:hypothetical protein n=1 Tax=Frondihabitans cladoniiphilus TaxID=715785 RepID=UPI0031E8C410
MGLTVSAATHQSFPAVVGAAAASIAGAGASAPSSVGGTSSGLGAGVTCPAAAPVVIGTITVPAGPVAGYCQDRLVNAAHIMVAGKAMGLDTHAQAIGVMTAMGESSLVNVDHGDAVGPDSRGLFQQRANGTWGTYEQRMTPEVAATSFFSRLIGVPNWNTEAPTLAAHAVQINADPYHYAKYWPAAEQVVDGLSAP